MATIDDYKTQRTYDEIVPKVRKLPYTIWVQIDQEPLWLGAVVGRFSKTNNTDVEYTRSDVAIRAKAILFNIIKKHRDTISALEEEIELLHNSFDRTLDKETNGN